MRYSWGIFYLFFWLYRSAFSVIAQTVVARLTSLGDSGQYQAGAFTILDSGQLAMQIWRILGSKFDANPHSIALREPPLGACALMLENPLL